MILYIEFYESVCPHVSTWLHSDIMCKQPHILYIPTHILTPLSAAPSQCDALPVCRHRGCDVVLHGRQEVQDGFSGGSSVTTGQSHLGGAEHPAGS